MEGDHGAEASPEPAPAPAEVHVAESVVRFDDGVLEEFYLNPSVAGARNGAAAAEHLRPPTENESLELGKSISTVYQNTSPRRADFAGLDAGEDEELGTHVAVMPKASLLGSLPWTEFVDLNGELVDEMLGIGRFHQAAFALVISKPELEASEAKGRLLIHTGERWDQFHTGIVNAARFKMYSNEGVDPDHVYVISAGTLLFQSLEKGGWEVVAVLSDSGHYRPKSKSVRHVYQCLQELGYDCVRICKGTNEVLAELAQREAQKRGEVFDHEAVSKRGEAWVKFIRANYSQSATVASRVLIGLARRLTRSITHDDLLGIDGSWVSSGPLQDAGAASIKRSKSIDFSDWTL